MRLSGEYDYFDLSKAPHMAEPLGFWAIDGRARGTVMAVEQTGKSLSWQLGLAWTLIHKRKPSLVVYESGEKAADINKEKFEPLLESVPQIAHELANPNTRRKDHYSLAGAPIYFTGGGTPITSHSICYLVGDEVDNWVRHNEDVDNVANLDKRRRTYSDGKLFLVCSPRGGDNDSIIFREFQKSSMGYWYLRCLRCGELSMRSCDIGGREVDGNFIGGLNWEWQEKEIVADSIRLMCPACGNAHHESQKSEMCGSGGYIHAREDRRHESEPHLGWQWGALASLMPGLSWIDIARAQMAAGRGNIKSQLLFDNSFRGLTFKPRYLAAPLIEQLNRMRQAAPQEAEWMGSFITVDTQGDNKHNGHFYYVCGTLCANDRLHVQSCGKLKTFDDIEIVVAQAWNLLGYLHDEGGKREQEVRRFIGAHRRGVFFAYKGGAFSTLYRLSKEVDRLMLVREKDYKAALIRTLYHQREGLDGRITFNPDLPSEFFKQVASVQRKANPKTKEDNKEENWESTDGEDHYFDCMKMMLAIKDFQVQYLPKSAWRNGCPNELGGAQRKRKAQVKATYSEI